MEHKEGLSAIIQPEEILSGCNNNSQKFDPQHAENLCNRPIEDQLAQTSIDNNENKPYSSNYLGNGAIDGNLTGFSPLQIASLSNTDVCLDTRLLDAAKDGKTDRILQLIEEEGQQLHSYKDKVQNYTHKHTYTPYSK